MCPFYLDGEPIDVCIVHRWGLYPLLIFFTLAFVQFSSFAVDGRRGIPATRSLRTEQRKCKSSRLLQDRVRSTFQERPAGPKAFGADSLACGRLMRPLAWKLPRKEVIQPQLPLRLPCYDFTPITSPTFDSCLP